MRYACVAAMLALAGCSTQPRKTTSPAQPGQSHVLAGTLTDCGKLVKYVRPIYPKEARRRRIQGIVRLRVHITKNGEIRGIEVLEGNPLLVPATLACIRKWRYAPCLLNSDPVEIRTTIDIPFNLNQ